MKKSVLYISYDGMTDALGRSQVLPYLCGLSKKGFDITLVSAEKPEFFEQGKAVIENIVKDNNIDWHPINYTKKPPVLSTIYDVFKIKRKAIGLYKQKGFQIVHCRSYISAFAGVELKRRFGVKFVFDMRGFYADERVDGGIWQLNNFIYKLVYKFFKRKERFYFSYSDAIVSLTNVAKEIILSWQLPNVSNNKITVIPCCADIDHFDYHKYSPKDIDNQRKILNISADDFVLSYLGSVGTWYMLPQMLDFFAVLLKQNSNALFLFITRDSADIIFAEAQKRNIPADRIVVKSAMREEVPLLALLSSVSLFFIKPVWSKKASSPTKLAELMALGIPCITNSGVGDVDAIIKQNPLGILINEWTDVAYKTAIDSLVLLDLTQRERVRMYADDAFSLRSGVESYNTIYNSLV